MYNYKATVKKIVDGDTIDVVIDLGFKIYAEHRLRLARINTPELKAKDESVRASAIKAKEFVSNLLLNKEVIITTSKTDIYGRYLAEVVVDGKNVSDMLLENNLAVLYI